VSAGVVLQFDDRLARQRIRTSLDESLIVEAAAGTGKTTELVSRIVAVLARGGARIERVAAVTFTRKAAGELKLRLRQELDRARSETADDAVRSSLEDALERLEEARVGTIHSFCADILRERPVEAAIDPAFEELSESEARRLQAQAFRSWIQDRLGRSSPGLRRALVRLARVGSRDERTPMERLEAAAAGMFEWRDFPAPWRREAFDREREIDALVGRARELAAAAARCPEPKDALRQNLRPAQDLATWVERAEGGRQRDHDSLEGLLIQLLGELKASGAKKSGKGSFAPGLIRERVVETRDRLIADLEAFRRRADADLAALLRSEMWEVVERYDTVKRRAGGLDFVDLLLKVRNLLRDNAEVRAYLQGRFSHLFVDEFQDTDPLQAEILILLAAQDPGETDWRKVTPVAGKLFLVGDPKQSIYRFRRADVVLYHQVRRSLVERGVGLVHLTRSFRALEPLQQFVNAAFEPEMRQDDSTGQPAYVPLEPDRRAGPGQPCVIALPAPYPYGFHGITKRDVSRCLPDVVAAFLEWLLESSGWQVQDPEDPGRLVPVEAQHVCLLFRHFLSYGTDTTREYLRALEARGIPHLLVGAKSFHRREEVETLRAALTAVEWPDDELSVYALLRGSLFAIPDSVLLRYTQEAGRLHPFRPPPQQLEAAFQPVVQALDLLGELHRERNRRPMAATVQALLEAARAHAGFALRPAGNQVLGNVERISDLARGYELGGGISFRGLVEELAAQAGRQASRETPVLEEGAAGVRVMTVHTAKGLEFPVVVLADITTRLARDNPDMYVDPQSGLCAMPLVGLAPWELLDHRHTEQERDRAEGVRVAYVAATRARDLLVTPAVGDEALPGCWLEPMNKALYPPRPLRRAGKPAPGCPSFGELTVLQTPPNYGGGDEFCIRPGLHQPQQGHHSVVWWDPSKLRLKVEANLGLRLETVLAEDQGSKAAAESVRGWQQWQKRRAETLERGRRPAFQAETASQTQKEPPIPASAVRLESMPRPGDRPAGRRFGTLVHTVLRDVDLAAGGEEVGALARFYGRLAGAPEAEANAAAESARAVLAHPLLRRAAAAPSCRREWPFLIRLEDEGLLEGVVDLAFLEPGCWTVVDFKTAAEIERRGDLWRRQLRWYVFAISQITGQAAQGWLLGV